MQELRIVTIQSAFTASPWPPPLLFSQEYPSDRNIGFLDFNLRLHFLLGSPPAPPPGLNIPLPGTILSTITENTTDGKILKSELEDNF